MANKFFAAIRARFFNTAADTALDVGVNADAHPRLTIDAGGKISWGDGTNAVDTNIYRDSASVLKTDDTLKVPVLFIDGIEVDTTGATTDQILKYNGTKFIPAPDGGDGGFVAQTTAPVDTGLLWLDTDEPAVTVEPEPTSPTFTYTSGLLTGITYGSGGSKSLTYTSGLLSQVDFTRNGVTTRKTFNYTSGVLTSISQVTL
jgi:hypothetical protein